MKITRKKTICFLTLVALLTVCSIGQAQTSIIKSDTATMNTCCRLEWHSARSHDNWPVRCHHFIRQRQRIIALGGNTTLAGLLFGTMNGPVTVGNGNTLTLGNSGIDMSAANQNVTLNNKLKLASGIQKLESSVSGQTLTIGKAHSHTRVPAWILPASRARRWHTRQCHRVAF